MLPPERQQRLSPILDTIRGLPGVAQVQQDDFDSAGVNVFITLKPAQPGKPIFKWAVPLRTTKHAIKVACTGRCSFLHWPSKRYSWSPSVPGIPRERYDEGYDCDHIKIEVSL